MLKILAINDVSEGGGAGQLFHRTNTLLRKAGHEVTEVTGSTLMESSKSAISKARFKQGLSSVTGGRQTLSVLKAVYNEGLAIKRAWRHVHHPKFLSHVKHVITHQQFDLAHVHNLHHFLSPQVFQLLAEYKIPIVYQINDYFFFCNNYAAYNKMLDEPCKKCIRGNSLWALRYRCSSYGSVHGLPATAIETLRRWLLNRSNPWKWIDSFVVTADIVGELIKEWGVPVARIHKMFNPMIVSDFGKPRKVGQEIVFYGGYLQYKGVRTFMEALEFVKSNAQLGVYLMEMPPDYGKQLREVAQRRGLRISINPDLRWNSGLKEVVANSRAVVVPSQWWVTSENVVYEAMLSGRAVIASRAGGNAELIRDGETGILFPPGNPKALAARIDQVTNDENYPARLGLAAYHEAQVRFSEQVFLNRLVDVYGKTISAAQ